MKRRTAVTRDTAQLDWISDLSGQSPSAAQTLQWLTLWADAGWLRRLDAALASQLLRLDGQASPALLVAAALLAQMEGRGHTCLPLPMLLRAPVEWLGWPAQAVQGEQGLHALWQHMPGTLDGWHQALCSPVLRHADQPDAGQPLVLGGTAQAPLLYLRRYAAYERRVGQGLRERALARLPIPRALAGAWLDRLFGPAGPEIDWQRAACAVALRAPLAVITGGPGTGKTYTAARLLALQLAVHAGPAPLRVALAAPTGKAAARLKQSIDKALVELPVPHDLLNLRALVDAMGPARTLHSLLGARPDTRRMRHHAAQPLDVDVLMVDEASMVHLEMMDALLAALPPHARLILLGDKDQLASVEAGAVLGDLCRHAARGAYSADTVAEVQAVAGQQIPAPCCAQAEEIGREPPVAQVTVMLRQSRRFEGPIGELASAVNQGDAVAARATLTAGHAVLAAWRPATVQALCDLALDAAGGWADFAARVRHAPQDPALHAHWVKGVLQSFDRLRILCAVREGEWGVSGLNARVQKALAERAGLPVSAGEWYAGRPVMVLRNDAQTGVFNGDVGVALPPADGQGLRVWFQDGEALRSVAVMRLPDVQTAFAMTVHKSQGSEFAHTVLVLPPGGAEVLSRELVYTGITRARERFTLVEAADGLLEAALARPSVRASGLGQWWDQFA